MNTQNDLPRYLSANLSPFQVDCIARMVNSCGLVIKDNLDLAWEYSNGYDPEVVLADAQDATLQLVFDMVNSNQHNCEDATMNHEFWRTVDWKQTCLSNPDKFTMILELYNIVAKMNADLQDMDSRDQNTYRAYLIISTIPGCAIGRWLGEDDAVDKIEKGKKGWDANENDHLKITSNAGSMVVSILDQCREAYGNEGYDGFLNEGEQFHG